MAPITKKVRELQKRARAKGQWAVVAAAGQLLNEEESLDARINFVGSIHEVGLLKNSLAPYWNAWRTAPVAGAWARRCVDRLQQSDGDYWAVAALLGLPMSEVQAALAGHDFKLAAVRFAESYRTGRWHIATFCRRNTNRTLAPVIEAGWNDDAEVVEASRWRAVILEEMTESSGSLVGRGFGSYHMRAALPHGCWRIHEDVFEIRADWVVPKSRTMLRDYP